MKTSGIPRFLPFLLGITFFSLTQPVVAQPEPVTRKNTLGLEYGLHYLQRQDLLLSPLLFRGQAPANLNLTYRRLGDRMQHEVELGVQAFSATTHAPFTYLAWQSLEPTQTLPSTFALLHFRYTWLHRLNPSQKLQLWLGASSDNRIDALFLEFGGAGAFSYGGYLSLGPTVQVQFMPSARHTFFAAGAVPVVSWVARSPYALNDDVYIWNQRSHRALPTLLNFLGHGEIVSLNRLQQLQFQVGYQRQLSNRFSLRTHYGAFYARYPEPRPTVTLTNSLTLGLQVHF